MSSSNDPSSTSAGLALARYHMVQATVSHLFMEEDVMFACFFVPLGFLIYELVLRWCCGVGRKRGLARAKLIAPSVQSPSSPPDDKDRAPGSDGKQTQGKESSSFAPGSIFPLTEEQLDAYRRAKEVQRAVYKAAHGATRDEKLREDNKWKRNGGTAIEKLLPSTPLVDAQYLISLAELNGILPPFEEMPSCALLDASSAWRLRTWQGFSSLPALVVSMPWLDAEHPDKHGEQLRSLVPILVAMVDAAQGAGCPHSTIGVFVEYCCLPGHPDDVQLANRVRWFSHPCTHVLLLNANLGKPAAFGFGRSGFRYADTRSFGGRGWQVLDERASCLLKYSHCYWEMSKYVSGDTYEEIYKTLPALRKPLLAPPKMRRLIEEGVRKGTVSFSEADDVETACMLYEGAFLEAFETFHTTCPGRNNLFYQDTSWSADDAKVLAEGLGFAAKQCKLKKELTVHVGGGGGFAAAATAIAEAVKGTAIRVKIG